METKQMIYRKELARNELAASLPLSERAKKAVADLDSALTWQNPNAPVRSAMTEGANVIDMAMSEREALKARVAELEAALREITEVEGREGHAEYMIAMEQARAALRGTKEASA